MKTKRGQPAPPGYTFSREVMGYRVTVTTYYCDGFGITINGVDAGIIFYSEQGRRGRYWMTGAGLLFPTAAAAIAYLCRGVGARGGRR